MELETRKIGHPVLGRYEQRVFASAEEAGHEKLPSDGEFGWEMPTEPATERFILQTKGKVVLDVGCGLGGVVAIPSLLAGASKYYAIDVDEKQLEVLAGNAKRLRISEKLTSCLVSKNWWFQDLMSSPTVARLIRGSDQLSDCLPEDAECDIVVARHSIQFGSPDSILRVFDLVTAALKRGGTFTSINFTPFVGYIHKNHGRELIEKILGLNFAYAAGKSQYPGGYLNKVVGPMKLSLGDLAGSEPKFDLKRSSNFTYIDAPTLQGLLKEWARSREMRGLDMDLLFDEGFYFSPSKIARNNKLSGAKELEEKENYLFVLKKI